MTIDAAADGQLRRAIGEALLRAYAARPDAPPEIAHLLDKLDRDPAPVRR